MSYENIINKNMNSYYSAVFIPIFIVFFELDTKNFTILDNFRILHLLRYCR
jgi:hypothetical protein